MKIKTSELKGVALDWAVIEALRGHTGYWMDCYLEPHRRQYCETPSSNWAQGGPIIERERIAVRPFAGYWMGVKSFSSDYGPGDACVSQQGKTPLIATMRCYVASKLGNEVEVPEELL